MTNEISTPSQRIREKIQNKTIPEFMQIHGIEDIKQLHLIEDSIEVKNAKTGIIKITVCGTDATFRHSRSGNPETTNSWVSCINKKLDSYIYKRIKRLKDFKTLTKNKGATNE
ncbi:hypothetical protein VCRA2117O328_10224 [Vibrio crassostreae]|nr:hypothetical protein VCRA2117O328_10224 [Vibrio crassostreae]